MTITERDGVWYVVTESSIYIRKSIDIGQTWTTENAPTSGWWRGITAGVATWLAFGMSSTKEPIILENCIEQEYVKTNGNTFTAPQEGVPGTDPNHLATVSQLMPTTT